MKKTIVVGIVLLLLVLLSACSDNAVYQKGFIRKYSVLLYHIGDIGEAYDEDKLLINLLETLTKLITVPDGNVLITLYSSQCDILLILDA